MGQTKVDRVGEVTYTKFGSKATIVNYPNRKNIDILYEKEWNGHIFSYISKHRNYSDFIRKDTIRSPYDSGILDGYITTLKYPNCPDIRSSEYRAWATMMEKFTTNVSYKWRYFKNFVKWYNNQKKLYPEGTKLFLCHYKINGKFIGPSSMLLLPIEVKNIMSRQNYDLLYYLGYNNKLYASITKGTQTKNIFIDKINDSNKIYSYINDIKNIIFENYKEKIIKNHLPKTIENRLLKYNPFSNKLIRRKKY